MTFTEVAKKPKKKAARMEGSKWALKGVEKPLSKLEAKEAAEMGRRES